MSHKLIVIGASQGGFQAIKTILSALPDNFAIPITIVQHRVKNTDNMLTELLQRSTKLAVKEPEDHEPILPGCVYLAPSDYHLLVESSANLRIETPSVACKHSLQHSELRSDATNTKISDAANIANPAAAKRGAVHNYQITKLINCQAYFTLSLEPPVWYARPSIDVLFDSAAVAYEKNVVGIILTGANQDGAQGISNIKKQGGLTIVQKIETAEKTEMPSAAIAAAKIDYIVTVNEIAPLLVKLCSRKAENPSL